jgi:hypothetical protein
MVSLFVRTRWERLLQPTPRESVFRISKLIVSAGFAAIRLWAMELFWVSRTQSISNPLDLPHCLQKARVEP